MESKQNTPQNSSDKQLVTNCDQSVMSIESRIFTIRGKYVMIDSDLAKLYGVETRRLNEQVKRNIERFPEDFMFQLTKSESENLISQFATSSWGGTRKLPFAFTENGVAMLSGVLKSKTAIEVNIRIMRAFTSMRNFLMNNASIFQRIERIEMKQLKTDEKVDAILDKLNDQSSLNQGLFFDGQNFDAYVLACDLIQSAKRRIVLIDNYADYSVLRQLDKRAPGVSALIYTSDKNDVIKSDLKRHNKQYPPIDLKIYNMAHDRFLIIDDTIYHIGASLKDLGKKMFGFSKMEEFSATELLARMK